MLLNKRKNYEEKTASCSDADLVDYAKSNIAKYAKCKNVDQASKPFPALTQCYKFNGKSCCKSAHDSFIKDEYQKLLSPTCLREYPALEFYYCLGCHPQQMKFVDVDAKEIHICESFAKSLWEESDYDRCGLNVNSDSAWPVVLPRIEYDNATMFLQSMKPPFFEDYTVVIDKSDGSDCFSSSAIRVAAYSVSSVLSVFALAFLLM